MHEGHQVAYLELWRNRARATTTVVTVRLDGSRRLADRPKLRSEEIPAWLKTEGFVFQRLLPPSAVRVASAGARAGASADPPPTTASPAVFA